MTRVIFEPLYTWSGSEGTTSHRILATQGLIRLGSFRVQTWRFNWSLNKSYLSRCRFLGITTAGEAPRALAGSIADIGTQTLCTLADGSDALEITLTILLEANGGVQRVDLPDKDLDSRAVSWL